MKEHSHHRPSDEEAIEATAAAWLAQRDDGLSPEEEAEFTRWLAADRRHKAAVGRLETTWNVLQQLREYRPEARMHPDRDLLRLPVSRRVLRFPVLAVATGMAAALALAAVWWISPKERSRPEAVQAQNYATTMNGYQTVALDDGSVVELNASSEIRVQFSAAERGVQLVRGEAHFTVAKDPGRPFVAEAGTVAMRAVGTAFNVRLAADRVEVLVTEGSVRIGKKVEERTSRDVQKEAAEQERGAYAESIVPLLLAANERAVIPTVQPASAPAVAPGAIERVSPEAIREALAWQGARLVFVDTPLGDAIGQFNRRNLVQLELADAELATLPIGGSFRPENLDAFVRLLASGGDVVVERPAPERIVLRKIGPSASKTESGFKAVP
jgi:transmembrane sensor